MKNFSWYISRLSKMPPPEVLSRLRHKLAEKQDRAAGPALAAGCSAWAGQAVSPRVFALQQGGWPLEGAAAAAVVAMAEEAVANRVDVFGIAHDFGDRIDWHLDVKTGQRWPFRFWGDVDIRDGFTIGGVKFVWEPNRLYGLHILGLAYRLTGEEKYASKIFSLLAEWLEANPYPMGVNWTSGIELGVRIANLVWGLSCLGGRNFSEAETELIGRFVWLHGRHLYRYPSKYSSNNNHAIAEAFALFLIGVFFPGFVEADKWRAFGQQVLDREVARQILPDGGSYECSTTYLSFVFDFFLLYKLVCEKMGLRYAPVLDERLESSCEYLHFLMDAGGNVPNIGDQDSAVLVNFGLDNQANLASILNTGSILYDRPEFRRSNFPDSKTLLLVGDGSREQAVCRREEKATRRTLGEVRLFEDSGLAVIRGPVAGREVVLVGNATPLGMPPLYAHGHLDALSVTLSVGGLEFLVDPGTYLYHCGGRWRRYFRSTAAHNTVRVEGADMSEQVGDFMFGRPYRITEHSIWADGEKFTWRAGHDAYGRLPARVSHQRQVSLDFGAERGEIRDHLTGRGRYRIELFFHFHPACDVRLGQGAAIAVREGCRLELGLDPRLALQLYKGSEEPLLGWFSPAFNRLEECCTVVAMMEVEGEVELLTGLRLGA